MTSERETLFDSLPLEEQGQRLRHALDVLTIWLVQAQTGFGDRDADGIANLIQHGRTPVTNPVDSPITEERPRDVGAPGAAT